MRRCRNSVGVGLEYWSVGVLLDARCEMRDAGCGLLDARVMISNQQPATINPHHSITPAVHHSISPAPHHVGSDSASCSPEFRENYTEAQAESDRDGEKKYLPEGDGARKVIFTAKSLRLSCRAIDANLQDGAGNIVDGFHLRKHVRQARAPHQRRHRVQRMGFDREVF